LSTNIFLWNRDLIFLLIREKCTREVARCRGVHVGQNGQEFLLSTYPFKEYQALKM